MRPEAFAVPKALEETGLEPLFYACLGGIKDTNALSP